MLVTTSQTQYAEMKKQLDTIGRIIESIEAKYKTFG
jgi:hypothetical protein